MFLEEILADRRMPFEEVASWAARGFGTPLSAVVVESEDDRGGALGDEIELLIEIGELTGDFPAHLSFFARSPRTEAADRDTLVADFARHFQSHLLVSDESPDPYRMTQVKPDGSQELVRLNAEALDSEDSYVVDGPYVPEEGEGGGAVTDDRLAIPIDLLEDFAQRLGSIVSRLDDTKATLRAFEEDMGDGSVVDALDHFEHNWKDGRGDIHKQLDGLEKMANTVVREMRKADTDLAQELAKSTQPQGGKP